MKLTDFQDRFQRSILEGDDEILDHIPDGPRETKKNLLGVYRDAYVLRLVEVMGSDHEQLRNYLGEKSFNEMARAYIASQPSHHPNARWFTRGLPEFLKANEAYSRHPIVCELATLEKALNDAFDGIDAPTLSMADLTAVPPQEWGQISFEPHPTASLIDAQTNIAAIWRALKEDREPPPLTAREEFTHIVVWRHELMPMFREMTAEEVMMWRETVNGSNFEKLCELVAFYDEAETAPVRAAGYLKGWLEAGLLSAMARSG